MPNSALQAVSAGIFARLNVTSLKAATPTGAGCIGGVKEYVPQPPTYPFLLYSLSEKDISGLGSGLSVKQMPLRLHVFSKWLGMSEAQRIMTEAIRLLQFSEPTVTGWSIPAIGRPNDVIAIETSEINGEVVRELVSIWDHVYADEVTP